MAVNIETTIQDNKQIIKAIILNMPKVNHLAYEMKATDSIPIYCLHADAYPTMAMSQKEITSRPSRFYMMVSSNLDDMEQHMQQSDLSTNAQTLHDHVMYFIRKVSSDDEPEQTIRRVWKSSNRNAKISLTFLSKIQLRGTSKN